MLHYDLHVPPTLYRVCCGAEGDEGAPRRVCDEKRQQYCRQRHSVRSAVALKGHSFFCSSQRLHNLHSICYIYIFVLLLFVL